MKHLKLSLLEKLYLFALVFSIAGLSMSCTPDKSKAIFDGTSFSGWEGDFEWFFLQQKSIVAGSLGRDIPKNQFLCTTQEYGDFVLKASFKVVGLETNGGIQFRSQRVENSNEVSGYQADIGQNYTGSIYDEARRNAFLVRSSEEVQKKIRPSDPEEMSDYVIRAEGPELTLHIDGIKTASYTETDNSIPRSGKICVQIHSGAPGEIWYKDIRVEEILPQVE